MGLDSSMLRLSSDASSLQGSISSAPKHIPTEVTASPVAPLSPLGVDENQRSSQNDQKNKTEGLNPVKIECLDLVNASHSFGKLSTDLWTLLSRPTPDPLSGQNIIRKEVQAFTSKEKNKKHIEVLKKQALERPYRRSLDKNRSPSIHRHPR